MAATVIERAKKDFYLKELLEHRIPLRFRFNGQEYTLTVVHDPKGQVCLQADRPVTGLRPGSRMELLFDFYGTLFQFTVEAGTIRKNSIVAARKVDVLRKDLERSFVRVAPPEGLRAAFVFQEERYALDFPRLRSYEPVRPPPPGGFRPLEGGSLGMGRLPPSPSSLSKEGAGFPEGAPLHGPETPWWAERGSRDIQTVIQGFYCWAGGRADGFKAALFNQAPPRRLEERLVAQTGLAFYIPSPAEGLVKEDPEGRMLTREQFLSGFERLGYKRGTAAELLEGIMKGKAERGVSSEVWAPIRFQEYVLGYVYLWTMREGKAPLDYQAVERAGAYTQEIASAFKEGGRLESRRVRNDAFEVQVLDISASGLRFCYPPGKPGLNLPPGVEMGVTLETPGRRVRTRMEIVRRVSGRVEMGGRFLGSGADDQRALFEYLYGESFTAGGQPFLAGKV
jgi:hypothetical protein